MGEDLTGNNTDRNLVIGTWQMFESIMLAGEMEHD